VASKRELVRLALSASHSDPERLLIALDASGTLPGRGAYLCREDRRRDLPNRRCLERAQTRRGLNRALRVGVPIDPELVESVHR
jgi:predicted RNA-binding protein YlxR (DUF448 family)